MAICENCGNKYNVSDGVENPFHDVCSKKCEEEFYALNYKGVAKSDNVKHPSRYNQGGIEFWDVEKAFFGIDSHVDHLVQSALEYGVRFRRKNGAEDLRKAANLLNVAAGLMEKSQTEEDLSKNVMWADGFKAGEAVGKIIQDKIDCKASKPHPLQNATTPKLDVLYYAIETFETEHGGRKPTVALVTKHFFDKAIEEANQMITFIKDMEMPNDNTTYIMGVRVVVTESTKDYQDVEVL